MCRDFVSIASAPHPPYPQLKFYALKNAHIRVSIASAPHPPYPLKMTPAPNKAVTTVSIASAPHPPYPLHTKRASGLLTGVSIASAPHPPYPLPEVATDHLDSNLFQSHLRPIHPIHPPCKVARDENKWFQSHLRPIHPIHFKMKAFASWYWEVSIASAPHPPYPPLTWSGSYER